MGVVGGEVGVLWVWLCAGEERGRFWGVRGRLGFGAGRGPCFFFSSARAVAKGTVLDGLRKARV